MEKWSRWMFFFFFFFYKSQNCFPLITLTSQSSFLDISSNLPGSMAASILHGQTTLSWGVCGKVTQPKENCENEEKIFRDTVFLMFSLVLQHFSLEQCSQHKLPSLDSVGGLTIGPQEYWATIKRSM